MARVGLWLLLGLALWLMPSGRAEAQYRFGSQDEINRIQDVKLKGADNEELFLGYIVRTHWFFLGYNVEDRGYILGIPGGGNRFYEMPKGDELAGFQRNGYLPDPLPPYSLSFWDYLFGYSDWWSIPIIVALSIYGSRRRKRKAAEKAAAAGTSPAPLPPAAPVVAAAPPPPGPPPPPVVGLPLSPPPPSLPSASPPGPIPPGPLPPAA